MLILVILPDDVVMFLNHFLNIVKMQNWISFQPEKLLNLFNWISAPGLIQKLDQGFLFRPEFMTMAQKTLDQVIKKHLAKQKNEKKKKKKKSKDITFVGIHSR